ncbi:MAG TPA: caspase family protein [Thermoanaerobaculia bacterium]|jgi:hypothetical protein
MDKALVIGVADYNGLYPVPLQGATAASASWRDLLTDQHYQFRYSAGDPNSNLRVLESRDATKAAILDDLAWLVRDAGPNDRAILIFCGHGAQLDRRDPRTGVMYKEQGLVTHPANGESLPNATLFGDEISVILRSAPVRITVVIDACHSGGVFDGSDALKLRPLFIALDSVEGEPQSDVPVLSLTARLVEPLFQPFDDGSAVKSSLVVLAASAELLAAYEAEISGARQMLFTHAATGLLAADRNLTFDLLWRQVTHSVGAHQTPQLTGDRTRFTNLFTF